MWFHVRFGKNFNMKYYTTQKAIESGGVNNINYHLKPCMGSCIRGEGGGEYPRSAC